MTTKKVKPRRRCKQGCQTAYKPVAIGCIDQQKELELTYLHDR